MFTVGLIVFCISLYCSPGGIILLYRACSISPALAITSRISRMPFSLVDKVKHKISFSYTILSGNGNLKDLFRISRIEKAPLSKLQYDFISTSTERVLMIFQKYEMILVRVPREFLLCNKQGRHYCAINMGLYIVMEII